MNTSSRKKHLFLADNYRWQVRVRAAAHLDCWITDCFGDLKLEHHPDGTTSLTGALADLPAVYGLILQLRDGGVDLLFLQVEKQELG